MFTEEGTPTSEHLNYFLRAMTALGPAQEKADVCMPLDENGRPLYPPSLQAGLVNETQAAFAAVAIAHREIVRNKRVRGVRASSSAAASVVSGATALRTKLTQVDEDQEAGEGAVEDERRRVANFRDLKQVEAWSLVFRDERKCECPRGCLNVVYDDVHTCEFCTAWIPGVKSCNCRAGCCDNVEDIGRPSTEPNPQLEALNRFV